MRATILLTIGVAMGLLGSCAEIPNLAGLPPQIEATPVAGGAYRNLADLPDKPVVPPAADNQKAVQSLTTDRAKAAQEADRLRLEPFVTPDPPPPSGF